MEIPGLILRMLYSYDRNHPIYLYVVTDIQAVVGAGRPGLGGDVDGGSGDGTGGGPGGGGDGLDRDGRLIRWEDTVANVILGMEPNALLAYAPGLELHHLIMSMLGGTEAGQREREISL